MVLLVSATGVKMLINYQNSLCLSLSRMFKQTRALSLAIYLRLVMTKAILLLILEKLIQLFTIRVQQLSLTYTKLKT